MTPGFRKDIQCHEWPYSFLQITRDIKHQTTMLNGLQMVLAIFLRHLCGCVNWVNILIQSLPRALTFFSLVHARLSPDLFLIEGMHIIFHKFNDEYVSNFLCSKNVCSSNSEEKKHGHPQILPAHSWFSWHPKFFPGFLFFFFARTTFVPDKYVLAWGLW